MKIDEGKCAFCHKGKDEEDVQLCGKLYIHGKRAAHYNCMLFSSGLYQKDTSPKAAKFDDFGGGFEVKSVIKEMKRGQILRCSCKSCHDKKGATVGCDRSDCKATYHYLCAMKEGKFHQRPSDEMSDR
ncbi:PHD finger protein 6-like [Glandiceps talaboti]